MSRILDFEELTMQTTEEPFVKKGVEPFRSAQQKINYANIMAQVRPGFTVSEDHAILKCEKFRPIKPSQNGNMLPVRMQKHEQAIQTKFKSDQKKRTGDSSSNCTSNRRHR